ncbi:TIGR03943 family protein [Streptomyces sp. NPDC002588]|uniref:TIGR03943 family putative permease subunit n=1 Tax=Streptomyces sp. NPDC002588 TaxID=3154419 RepID=UPI00333395C7
MKRFVQVALLLLGGLGLLQTSLFTDEYLRLVKEGMRPLLVVSGVVLVGLGVVEAWSVLAGPGHHGRHGHHPEGAEGVDGHGHDHSGVPRVAWLLFLPVLSLLFYAPPALGSYTAAREPAKAVAVQDEGFDPLPATSPLPMTLTGFTQRVQQDRSRAVRTRTVLMTGFVSPAPAKDDGWYLTRIIISCCAADASSVKVLVHGVPAPKTDSWVNVTGTWHASGTLGTSSAVVALDGRSVKKVRKPSNSYMDALPLD